MRRNNGLSNSNKRKIAVMGGNQTRVASFIAGIFAGILGAHGRDSYSIKPKVNRSGVNKYRPHQGKGERERRHRQISKGQLTFSNGLIR